MKTKLFFAIALIICTLFITSCSCKKKDNLEYKYVGAYVEVIEVENRTMEDRNIKLYYDENRQTLINTNKIYEYQIVTGTLTKDIKDKNYDLSASYSVTVANKSELKEINVYPITFDGTNYKILEDNNDNFDIKLFASNKSVGKKIKYRNKTYVIHKVDENSFKDTLENTI